MNEKSLTIRLLRLGARISAVFAPGLAARWLERLFLSPMRWPTPAREVDWVAGARRCALPFDGGRNLPVLSWGSGPTVLLVHGWSGRGSQLGAFVAPLVAQGFRVVSFDAPGHGQADGKQTALPEIARATAKVAELVGPVDAVIAHSLGTAATTIAVANGLPVKRLIYISPPENPGVYLYRVARFLGFGDGVARRTQARIEQRFGGQFSDVRAEVLAPALNVPLLVIHDQDDVEVPHQEGIDLVNVWSGAALMTTQGLGHRRILRAPEVVNAVVSFLSAPGASSLEESAAKSSGVLPLSAPSLAGALA
jgi:pimeloyl-ACP methyl ester carboxylesterase